MKQRIWELDVARGICLLFMIYGHIVYDVVYLFALAPLNDGGIFDWAVIHIGPTFIIISGRWIRNLIHIRMRAIRES